MKKYTKDDLERLRLEKYPNLSTQELIEKLKKEFHLTVINRTHSHKKKYLICESATK